MQKLLLGIFIFAIGLYPYNVVRQQDKVLVVGVDSRDSLLLGTGMAFILYYFFKVLLTNRQLRKVVYYVLICCCAITCNLHYLNYQKEAYWQEVLIENFRLNEEIYYGENFLFISDNLFGVGGRHYAVLNGLAAVAYGDQNRLLLPENAFALLDDEIEKKIAVDSGQGSMKEYDTSNNKLDGVIVYDCDINNRECILLKFYELTDWKVYQKQIEKMGKLLYYPADSREAEVILKRVETQ